MTSFHPEDFKSLEKLYRANLINSCTGYKSANLIATKSQDGFENVAIFSSVTHLGSHPPLLGFILRPTTIDRNTYDNLKKTGCFTVNHVFEEVIKDAHHTSAKYNGIVSEFDKTSLKSEYKNDFHAPFVQGSPVQLGCSFINEYRIKENGCIHIIGRIEHMHVSDNILTEDGWLNLEKAKTVTVNGLDGYALPKLIDRFDYARPEQEVSSIIE